MAYKMVWNAKLGRYVRRSTRKRPSTSGIASAGIQGLGAFGTGKSIKSMLGGVKGVIITGGIAAAGAISTDALFEKIGEKWEIVGWQRNAAKMATGIVLGILIAKVLKKPRLAAAFAIGPIVAGAMRIFADVLGETSGLLGVTVVEPSNRYDSMYGPFYGTGAPPALPVGSVTSITAADPAISPPGMYPDPTEQAASTIWI